MKKQVLFILLLLFSQYSIAQFPKKIDVENEKLVGNVKSVTTKYYNADEKFGEIVKTNLYNTHFEDFNKQGNYTEYEKESPAKANSFSEKYKYENGLLSETKFKSYNDYSLTERLYNKLGQIQELNDLYRYY